FMKKMDFKELGSATIPQIMLIYGACILSRMYNAGKRSKNELREEITRDSMGYTFWFFGTPILQRLFLKAFAPAPYGKALLALKQNPHGPFASLNAKQKLRALNHQFNPIAHYGLPSTRQIKEQMEIALHRMEAGGYKEGSSQFNHIQNYYKNL